MYLPGSRTLRSISYEATQPLRLSAQRLGVPVLADKLRRATLGAYIAARHRSIANRAFSDPSLEWARLCLELSDKSGYFFSPNLVSNESESLDAAAQLKALPAGLVQLGVGPETMLTYLGLGQAPLAFVVDIRRDNALLHYLYRAAFAESSTRTEWLSLLLARPYDRACDPGEEATVEDVLNCVNSCKPTDRSFEAAQRRIWRAIEQLPPFLLPLDSYRMRQIHRQFWRHGLEVSFQLEGPRFRQYPNLATLLCARNPAGEALGFLANETVFRRIQTLENANGVIPAVGSLHGGVLLRIGKEIERRGLQLGALYVSNVEQYLFENGQWQSWVDVLRRLPCHSSAILIRSYFQNEYGEVPDPPSSLGEQLRRTLKIARQVRRRRGPLSEHKMKTVVHGVHAFLEKQMSHSYTRYRELVSDRSLVPSAR